MVEAKPKPNAPGLSEGQRAVEAGQLVDYYAKLNAEKTGLPKFEMAKDFVCAETGLSRSTINRARRLRKMRPDLWRRVRRGEIEINEARRRSGLRDKERTAGIAGGGFRNMLSGFLSSIDKVRDRGGIESIVESWTSTAKEVCATDCETLIYEVTRWLRVLRK